MKGQVLGLAAQEWILGDPIERGGFGRVFRASSSQVAQAAAKLIPKDPGADRELLFVDLGAARNVVPVLDSGETEDHWVIVMPLAETSLRNWLASREGPVPTKTAVPILIDVATALADLDGRVVHRDLKPENVLLVDGSWCLADFGISRYAEATTAPDTRKFSLTWQYAAPERWRGDRASAATDVYSLGVMAFEMLRGNRPFSGPSLEEFREQHLHVNPESLDDLPASVASLVDECLYKASAARPTPANVLQRLHRLEAAPSSPGLARLEKAHRAEIGRRAEEARKDSEQQTVQERRSELFKAAAHSLERLADRLRQAIESAAPSSHFTDVDRGRGWKVVLGPAALAFSEAQRELADPWKWPRRPAFDVIATADLTLKVPADRYGYTGRSHSLWFCDAQSANEFTWFETAFMISPFMQSRRAMSPFALRPSEKAAKAVGSGMNEYQVAWPFTALVFGDLDEWVDRWAGWLAEGAEGHLHHPRQQPEHPTSGSWRPE